MKFAYLNLADHPRGNIILQHLIENNFIPSVIIEEHSPLSEKNRSSILFAFKDSSITFPKTEEIIKGLNIPVFNVQNHNNDECEQLLKEYDLDLITLGDTRIIKKNIRDIPKIGTINSHPGYLPDVKGNNPYIWAIIHDLPQGCSIHFIDENVDTGDIILREKIDIQLYKSYTKLLQKINNLCAELMLEAMIQIKNKTYTRLSQSKLGFVNDDTIDQEFYSASQDVKELAIKKLERQ